MQVIDIDSLEKTLYFLMCDIFSFAFLQSVVVFREKGRKCETGSELILLMSGRSGRVGRQSIFQEVCDEKEIASAMPLIYSVV